MRSFLEKGNKLCRDCDHYRQKGMCGRNKHLCLVTGHTVTDMLCCYTEREQQVDLNTPTKRCGVEGKYFKQKGGD